jgi:hypothetical protein
LPLNDLAAALVNEEITYEILMGEEKRRNYLPQYSRYYGLNDTRRHTAMGQLIQRSEWRYGHTCASWVTEKMKQIFGQAFATSELLGLTNTPRALGNTLMLLETRSKTTIDKPVYPK